MWCLELSSPNSEVDNFMMYCPLVTAVLPIHYFEDGVLVARYPCLHALSALSHGGSETGHLYVAG